MRHPSATPGATYDDEKVAQACKDRGWNDRATPEQQKIIDELFAVRAHRMQHAFWHAVRAGLEPKDQTILVTNFGRDWKNPHPLCPPPGGDPADPNYNPVGEDFLYMHHEMVQMLRAVMTVYGQQCIQPWKQIPDPKDWPLSGKKVDAKAPEALTVLKQWDAFIQDPQWMRKVSLSQLGWALEFTIHNSLHMRYATDRPAAPFRADNPKDDGATVPMNGAFAADWKFDDPGYNWLADPYGAAVNPIFWKIHGYVDNALSLWLDAHGYSRISDNCGSATNCYTWHGDWVGNTPALIEHSTEIPKTAEARGAGGGASGHGADGASDNADFNRRRLAHQRLGAITAKDFPRMKGPPKAGPPQDLLDIAKARVCP